MEDELKEEIISALKFLVIFLAVAFLLGWRPTVADIPGYCQENYILKDGKIQHRDPPSPPGCPVG